MRSHKLNPSPIAKLDRGQPSPNEQHVAYRFSSGGEGRIYSFKPLRICSSLLYSITIVNLTLKKKKKSLKTFLPCASGETGKLKGPYKKSYFLSFSLVSIRGGAWAPTLLYTCLVMQIVYIILVRGREIMISLGFSSAIDNI